MIFGAVCVVRWWIRKDTWDENLRNITRLLVFWFFIGLVLTVFYPSRQIADLAWVLAPLWGLAGIELAHYLPEGKPSLVSLLQALLGLLLAVLIWNTLISTIQPLVTSGATTDLLRIGLLSGIVLLGVLTTLLIGLGWNWEISRNGLVWGITISCLVYSISLISGAALVRPNQPAELWGVPPGTGETDLFLASIHDASDWQTGLPQFVPIQSTVDYPSLRWALRNFPDVQFTTSVPNQESPAVLITAKEKAVAPQNITDTHRGQAFTWRVWPAWTGPLPDNFLSWLTYRQAPVTNEQIILWVRSDLFPGASKGELP